MWLVTKMGVYRHQIVGLFSTESKAIEVALAANNAEIDDYHYFDIIKVEVDKQPDLPVDLDNGIEVARAERRDRVSTDFKTHTTVCVKGESQLSVGE